MPEKFHRDLGSSQKSETGDYPKKPFYPERSSLQHNPSREFITEDSLYPGTQIRSKVINQGKETFVKQMRGEYTPPEEEVLGKVHDSPQKPPAQRYMERSNPEVSSSKQTEQFIDQDQHTLNRIRKIQLIEQTSRQAGMKDLTAELLNQAQVFQENIATEIKQLYNLERYADISNHNKQSRQLTEFTNLLRTLGQQMYVDAQFIHPEGDIITQGRKDHQVHMIQTYKHLETVASNLEQSNKYIAILWEQLHTNGQSPVQDQETHPETITGSPREISGEVIPDQLRHSDISEAERNIQQKGYTVTLKENGWKCEIKASNDRPPDPLKLKKDLQPFLDEIYTARIIATIHKGLLQFLEDGTMSKAVFKQAKAILDSQPKDKKRFVVKQLNEKQDYWCIQNKTTGDVYIGNIQSGNGHGIDHHIPHDLYQNSTYRSSKEDKFTLGYNKTNNIINNDAKNIHICVDYKFDKTNTNSQNFLVIETPQGVYITDSKAYLSREAFPNKHDRYINLQTNKQEQGWADYKIPTKPH